MAAPRLTGSLGEQSAPAGQSAKEDPRPSPLDTGTCAGPIAAGSPGASATRLSIDATAQVNPASSVLQAPPSQVQTGRSRQEWLSTSTPAIYGSVRGRLPPTIDASVAPFCFKARQSFLNALLSDQLHALHPDYRSSFFNSEDAIRRLLPYHVWHIRDDDLLHIMGANCVRHGTSANCTHASASEIKARRRRRRDRQNELLNLQVDSFPSKDEAYSLWERFHGIEDRAKKLRRRLTGSDVGQAPSPFNQESCYHLEHLARETEQELLNTKKDEFRDVKEQAMTHGVTWEALMRISAGLELNNVPIMRHSTSQADASSSGRDQMAQPHTYSGARPSKPMSLMPPFAAGTMLHRPPPHPLTQQRPLLQNLPSRAIGPSMPVRGSRPRGRPRKQRDEQGRIIRTPPPVTVPPGQTAVRPSSTPATLDVMHQHQRGIMSAALTTDAKGRSMQPDKPVNTTE